MAPFFRSRFSQAQLLKHIQHHEADRPAKAKEKHKHDKQDGTSVLVVDHVIVDHDLARLELAVQGPHGGQQRPVHIVDLHVPHNALTCYVVTFHVGKVALKSLAGGDEILAVVDGNDNDQSASGLLVAYPILVANVLRHAEAVGAFHVVHHDKHRLYAALLVEPPQVNVGRVEVSGADDVVGIAHIAVAVLEMHHRYVVGRPRGRAYSGRDEDCHGNEQQPGCGITPCHATPILSLSSWLCARR